MMNFERPFVLWLILPALVYLIVIEVIGWRRTRQLLGRMNQETRSHYEGRRRIQAFILLGIAVALALVAIAGPYREGIEQRDALHAIFVLDVSWSMSAEDYPMPNPMRFARAKEAIQLTLERYREGQVGLVVFAGEAFTWVDRMRDFRAFSWMLENWVEIGQAPSQGSELAAGLRQALAVLTALVDDPKEDPGTIWKDPQTGKFNYWRDPTGKIRAVVVIVSDGTDKNDLPSDVMAEYRRQGVKVITIGVGSLAGTTVTLKNATGEEKPYETRLNELPLKAIAEATGGTYARLDTGLELMDAIAKHPEAFVATQVPVAAKQLFQWPLGTSLIFAILWVLSTFRR